MKVFQTILIVFLGIFFANSQSGPAGVGTSSNNVLWLKADAGTSTVVNGSTISGWNDQSGNAINVGQSNAPQRPVFRTNLMNGYPALEFDNNSTAGQNDFLTAPNNALLDNTAGYSIFTVSRLKARNPDAQSIISKRTDIDVNQAFMLFYHTGSHVYLDIDGITDRFSTSPSAYVANTNYIFGAVYDGTLGVGTRSKIYEGERLRRSSTESSSNVGAKVSPLLIGSTHIGDNRPFNGFISECIVYRTALNDAQRTIVNNYLSSKYDVALLENDKYDGDLVAKGSYFREVAGVGRESSGSNVEFSTSANGGLGIRVNSGLGNGDYVLSGYNLTTNNQVFNDVAGIGGLAPSRWSRIWYMDVTNNGATINTRITFNTAASGVGAINLGPAANYVLLYRSSQSGSWTSLANASAVIGQNIVFDNVNLINDGYFALGSINFTASPLPIELLSFDAKLEGEKVNLTWSTATEASNDYFTLEKTLDGVDYEKFATVQGAGNSSSLLNYYEIDGFPYKGISYYRLSQTDYSGKSTYFPLISVQNRSQEEIIIYPNPASNESNLKINFVGFENQKIILTIRNLEGKECYSDMIDVINYNQNNPLDCNQNLVGGTYFVSVVSKNKAHNQKLIIE